MPNQFEIQGSQNPNKEHKTVPLATTKIFTGYYPNSAPYRDAAVQYLYEKFYGASRNDVIRAGLNTEISPRLTLCRRPGNPVSNPNPFTAVDGFYSFRPFVAGIGEKTYVIVDEATGVYIGYTNAVPEKTLLYTKAAGAGVSRFQAAGNTLYWGDGVNTLKWSWFTGWAATTLYPAGTSILDANNNIQQSLGYAVSIVSTSVTTNVVTVAYTGVGTVALGDSITLYGLTTKTVLNEVTATVTSVGSGTFSFPLTTGNYTTTLDTGIVADASKSAAISGSSLPSFSGTILSAVLDGTVGWVSRGNAVQSMGIVAPVTAPVVNATPITPVTNWAASTFYWPQPYIVDSNATPYVWQLTTSGTTNSTVPSGLTTGTPTPMVTTVTDGTAVWTCSALATRQINTNYQQGQVILATWSESRPGPGGRGRVVTFTDFFQAQSFGTTSSAATVGMGWNVGLGATVVDGTVTWVNIGVEVTRLNSSTVAVVPGVNGDTAGNVGGSQLVSTSTRVLDSNKLGEQPISAGPSNTVAPTWQTIKGSYTTESTGITWQNIGAVPGAPNTGPWFYTFTYVNAATLDESTAAPLSQGILLPANSAIQVTGAGSTDTQVGQINIYRSEQQTPTATFGIPFFLASIPAPANGQSWSFIDQTPDPPNPGAVLNVLITAPGYGIVNGVLSNFNDPPPAGLTNLTFYAGRMWGTVGNLSYYSTGPDVTSGNGNTAWNAENFNETPGTMFKLWPTTVGIFHFTNDGLWMVQGLGTSTTPFEPIQLVDASTSIVSPDAFCLQGTVGLVYTSDRRYLSLDPQQGTTWLGQPVATDLIATYNPVSVYMTYHSNGLDRIGVITNGSTGWLSWETVPAPETGYLWNPPATILPGSGGVQAVASIETSPGIFTLLIGPSGTGPILARDSTFSTFTDNGTAYSSWAAFGNIVFAHPGQMAGLVHIGADYIRVGNKPAVSVLLDEVLGQPGTPPWVSVPNPVNDPPNLTASSSLFQLRYWMIETQEPVYCRVGLFKYDFGTDTVQNELLFFSIFGESITEEASV